MAKKNKNSTLTFNNFQPFLHIQDDILINKRGDYSILMKVEWAECFSYNEHDYELLIDTFASALDLLEPGIAVQRLDFYYPQDIELQERYQDYLEYKETTMHNGRIAQHYESYLVFTKLARPSNPVNFQNMIIDLIRQRKINGAFDQEHYTEEEANNFYFQAIGFCDTLNGIFSSSKEIKIRQLGKQEIFDLIYGKYFNLNLQKDGAVYMSDIHDTDNGGYLDDKHYSVFSMYADGLPPAVATSVIDTEYASELSALPVSMFHHLAYSFDFPRIVIQTYYTIDNNEMTRKIEAKKRVFNAFAGIGSTNRINRDNIELALESKDNHKLVKFQYGIIAIAPANDKTAQRKNQNAIKTYLTTAKVAFTTNVYNSLRFLFSYAPGNAGDIPEVDKAIVPSTIAACFGVYEGHGENAQDGVRLTDRKTQLTIDVDFWNHPRITNKNIILFGPSGTGKSFTVNTLNAGFIQQGTHLVVVDVGFSHKNLCKYYNGIFMECSDENPLYYNPFLSAEKDSDGRYLPPSLDITESITKLIYTAWKGRKNARVSDMTREELSVLMRFIPQFYEYVNRKSIVPDFTEFYHFFLENFYSDELTKKLRKDLFDIDSFKLILADFVDYKEGKTLSKGHYGDLLNVKENPDFFNDPYIVFELEYIKNNEILFPLTYHLINQIVMNKLLKQKKTEENARLVGEEVPERRLYFELDETWLMLKEFPAMATFLEYCTRTVRKHNGAVWLTTQTVNDIFDNEEVGNAIVGNCDIRMLKMHSGETKKYIQEKLNMSDHNLNLLYSISDKYQDIYIQFKDFGCVYSIKASPFTIGLFSSDPKHKKFIADNVKKTNSLRASLENFESYYLKN